MTNGNDGFVWPVRDGLPPSGQENAGPEDGDLGVDARAVDRTPSDDPFSDNRARGRGEGGLVRTRRLEDVTRLAVNTWIANESYFSVLDLSESQVDVLVGIVTKYVQYGLASAHAYEVERLTQENESLRGELAFIKERKGQSLADVTDELTYTYNAVSALVRELGGTAMLPHGDVYGHTAPPLSVDDDGGVVTFTNIENG